jgi:hypothetical protein
MGMPTVASVGTQVANTSTLTVDPGGDHAANDIDIMIARSGGADAAPSLDTANGFAQVAALSQGLSGIGGCQMEVFWRRWNGTDGSPVLADAGTFVAAQMISIRGCKTSGDPWNITSTGTTDGTADTSVSAAGATTTAADCLVLAMCVQGAPDSNSSVQFDDPSNADLANLTERMDQSRNLGSGGAFWMASGEKASAGAYGATTCTAATSARRVCGTLALEGAAAAATADPFPYVGGGYYPTEG